MFNFGKNAHYIKEVINLKFINSEHQKFYEEKLEEIGKTKRIDSYYRSLIYTLGVCETTRNNFNKIFNIKDEAINIDSICAGWQTTTSAKVTRMAFSLWCTCMYDSEENIEKEIKSNEYNVSEIFCCGYAPYFFEAIKIRYPEYTKESIAIEDELLI